MHTTQISDFDPCDVSDLADVVIEGKYFHCEDGQEFPYGRWSGGFFACDRFGWSSWHTASARDAVIFSSLDDFCPPPAAKTEPVQGLAALADSGQAGGILLRRPGVSVLFARSDSGYFDLVDDVWDVVRDARGYQGPNPVIAHPPCRGWGRLSHLAKPRHDEKALGLFAVECVRKYGGVLEHPWASKLWGAALLPLPGVVDAWGGFTILVDQGWFGHAAPKPTWLYVCGLIRADVPFIPVQLHRAAGRTLDLSPADRERTPPEFARFLVDIAGACNKPVVTSTQGVGNKPVVTRSGRRASYLDLADGLIG